MEKFVLTETGEEVKVGDILVKYAKMDTPMGEAFITQKVPINKTNIPELLKTGVITAVEGKSKVEECTTTVPMDINYYIEKISQRLGWKIDKTLNYLNNVDTIMPAAAFSIVLREIAIELDKKYKDHINNSPEIYTISSFDGRITKANKAHIKNYRNFAAFRSIEDTKIACRIVKPLLKEMFKSESK